VLPGVLGIADARAQVRHGPRRDAVLLQDEKAGHAGLVLADAGIVEEDGGEAHRERELCGARAAVRAGDDHGAGIGRGQLGDRVDEHHPQPAAACDLLLQHRPAPLPRAQSSR
jgi:hypothetical protein